MLAKSSSDALQSGFKSFQFKYHLQEAEMPVAHYKYTQLFTDAVVVSGPIYRSLDKRANIGSAEN